MLKKLNLKHAISSSECLDRLEKMKTEDVFSLMNDPGLSTPEIKAFLMCLCNCSINILDPGEPEVANVEITPELKMIIEKFAKQLTQIDILSFRSMFSYPPTTKVYASGISEKEIMDFLRKIFEHSRVSVSQTLPEYTPFVFRRRARAARHPEAGEKIKSPITIMLTPELKGLLNWDERKDNSRYIFPHLSVAAEQKVNSVKACAKEKAAFEKTLSEIENGENKKFSEAVDQHLQSIALKAHFATDFNFRSFQAAIKQWNELHTLMSTPESYDQMG